MNMNDVKEKIIYNQTFIDKINQILHNEGIGFETRHNLVCSIVKNEPDLRIKFQDIVSNETIERIRLILSRITIDKHEICQIIFMYFGNKHFKRQLDQFYTPITICNFIWKMLIPGKCVIDPACGTGDLISGYQGKKTMCDVSPEVLELTRFNHQNDNHSEIVECNSLSYFLHQKHKKYDYCVMNPPFGNKTIVDNPSILRGYYMGQNCKKQEIGVLFVELGLKLLKEDGFLFVIVPNGYLGNCSATFTTLRKMIFENYRLIGVIELPDNSFSRSGTGVSTSILIIKNEKCISDHPIFISMCRSIGYVLNKKNTPIKYKTDDTGHFICGDNNNPIIDDDLENTIRALRCFLVRNNIDGLNTETTDNDINQEPIEFFLRSQLDYRIIIDAKRYLKKYKQIIDKAVKDGWKKIKEYCMPEVSFQFIKQDKLYEYIDISSVSSPLYKKTTYPSHDLPSRAKHKVCEGDVLVSKLKGTISFTIITENNENLVASNGFCVLRPKDELSRVYLFANLFTSSFQIQHQSLATGSIMENISNDDIMNIVVEPTEELKKYSTLIETIFTLNNELLKIRN